MSVAQVNAIQDQTTNINIFGVELVLIEYSKVMSGAVQKVEANEKNTN